MIWSIVSKEEMDGCNSPVFHFQEEALGKGNISLAVVEESNTLDFIKKGDIVLLRTASKSLVDTIRKTGVKTTAETYNSYKLALDKITLTNFLRELHINVAQKYSISDIVEGETYFVKPRNGSDSKIPNQGICRTKEEVEYQMQIIAEIFNQDAIIEDYLPGNEYTVACVKVNDCIHTYPINIDNQYRRLSRKEINELDSMTKMVFSELGLKHHARMDFRADANGKLCVIDVNLIPGLGPSDKWTKCMKPYGMSYADSLKEVISSAY